MSEMISFHLFRVWGSFIKSFVVCCVLPETGFEKSAEKEGTNSVYSYSNGKQRRDLLPPLP